MVLSWEQATGLLYSSGDVQRISLWDTHKEIKIQVMWAGLTLIVSRFQGLLIIQVMWAGLTLTWISYYCVVEY